MKMFDPKADLFFEDPGSCHPSPGEFGVLYLLRRDICRCLGVDPVSNTITSHKTLWPGAMAILAGIDLLAKFYKGKDTGHVGERFRDFISEYFQLDSPEDKETIYQLRNSLLHSFGLYSCAKENGKQKEYRFILSASKEPLVNQLSDDTYQIDLITLHEWFEDSVKKYADALNGCAELQENFGKMFPNYGSVRIG